MKIANLDKYYFIQIQKQIGVLFIGESILQTFLTVKGFESSYVSNLTVCITITQLLTYCVSNFMADRISNIPRCLSKCVFGSMISFLILLTLSIMDNMKASTIAVMAIAAMVIYYSFMGLYMVLEFKMPYYLVSKADYHSVITKTPMIQGVTGVTASILFSVLVAKTSFEKIIPAAFAATVILCFAAYRIYTSFVNFTPSEVVVNKNRKSNFIHLKDKTLKWFVLPHLLRGVLPGVLMLGTVIFSRHVSNNPAAMTVISVMVNAATFIGVAFGLILFRKIPSCKVGIIGCIVEGAAIMFMLTSKTPIVFYVIFLTAYIGRIIVDLAVPIYVAETVPADSLGFYTSLRLMLSFIGVAIGNFIGGYIASAEIFFAQIAVIVVGIVSILDALFFALYDLKREKSRKGTYE